MGWRIKETGAVLNKVIGTESVEGGQDRQLLKGFVGLKGQLVAEDLDRAFVERYEAGEEHARSLVQRVDEDGKPVDDADVEEGDGSADQSSQYDPSDYNVEDVVRHLNELDDDDERVRIIAAEEEGKKRAGIVNWSPPEGGSS